MNLAQALEWERYTVEASAVEGGDLFATVKMVTEVPMNKARRGTRGAGAEANPYLGRLRKHCAIAGDVLVGSRLYAARVVAERRKEGVPNPEAFEVEKPSGRHHIEGSNAVTQADRDAAQFYFSLYFFHTTKRPVRVTSWYELDGIPVRVTPESDFAAYLPADFFRPKAEGAKQGVLKPIITRTPKLQSVVRVKCGRIEFDEERQAGHLPADGQLVEVEETAEEERPAQQ